MRQMPTLRLRRRHGQSSAGGLPRARPLRRESTVLLKAHTRTALPLASAQPTQPTPKREMKAYVTKTVGARQALPRTPRQLPRLRRRTARAQRAAGSARLPTHQKAHATTSHRPQTQPTIRHMLHATLWPSHRSSRRTPAATGAHPQYAAAMLHGRHSRGRIRRCNNRGRQ